MRIVFVSNYINHHQIPFCQAMCKMKDIDFTFIQTEPMEEERVRMGWRNTTSFPFLRLFYEEPEKCGRLIAGSEVVIFGGCEEESYIAERLREGKPVIRYSERLYREGQWKAISPRGLLKKYKDHGKYRNAPVYLLCAGAYVADDFHIIRAYPGKMYRWGYFPEKRSYDLRELFNHKGYYEDAAAGQRIPYLLWTARFIALKHPELAVYAAKHLKEKGIRFHLDMVGGGELEEEIKTLVKRLGLEDVVTLKGFLSPEEVRSIMERADIFLMTSNRLEGWGAVINEAMNSGCAVIADHMAGAVPYLIQHGENGLIYRDGHSEQLFQMIQELSCDLPRCRRLGENAYRTISETWNAQSAAQSLMELIERLGLSDLKKNPEKASDGGKNKQKAFSSKTAISPEGPCSPAPVIRERHMYRYLMERAAENKEQQG